MAQLVISAAGAAAGFAIGGPAGAQWGWMAGSLLGSLVGGKTTRQSQPMIDLKIVGTDYGQAIPYGRGTIPVAGQVWWNSDRQPISNTTTQRAGKGGGQKTETTTITYKVDLLIGLTDIPITGITRVWDTSSGKLIYHVAADAPSSAMVASGQTSEWDRMTVYTGAADQMPDPTYAAAVTNAPAYRDRGTVFIQGLNLGQSGQMRNLMFEVVIDGASTGIIEREWGGMGTSAEYNPGQEIAYDETRNELWTAYNLGSNGVGTTGKVAVYNLASEEWTFIDPPAEYSIRLNTNASVHAAIAHGKFYCQVRRLAPEISTTAIYDLASKTLLGTVQSYLEDYYPVAAYVAAIDEANGTVLIEDGTFGLNIHTMPSGIPTGAPLVEVSPGGSPYVATVDIDGNYWVLTTNSSDRVAKVSMSGMTEYSIAPYTPQTGHYAGLWAYDSARNGIYFFSTHDTYAYLYRFDCDDQTVSAVNSEAFDATDSAEANHWLGAIVGYDAENDQLVLKRGYNFGTGHSRLAYVDPDTGNVDQQIEVSSTATDWAGGNVLARRGFVWGLNNVAADSPDIAGFGEIRFATLADDPPTVQETVRDLCYRAGMSAGQFDVTELSTITRTVKCMPVAQISNVASVIDALAGVYFFDTCCDDKVRFFPRGAAPAVTIDYEDLGAAAPGATNDDDPLPLKERSDIEIPAQLLVTFANIDKDYEPDTQPSDRLTSTLDNSVETVDIALGMTPDEGKLVADANLLDQAASRWSAPVSLLGHYARVQPGDVVIITMRDGSEIRMRSTRMRDAFPILRHELVLDEPTALDSLGLTALDYTGSTEVAAPIATSMRILDIPILRDSDDDTGLYVATKPASGTDFPGSAIFDSADDSTFVRQATVLESAVFGTCTTALGDWTGPHIFDEINTVTVNVGEGTLSSSTRDLVLNNRTINAALVGDEIIQFVTATLVTAGVYQLSRLLRGARGTEWAMTDHAVADRFVLLREDGIRRVPVENSQLGLGRHYKAVTLGRSLSSATSQAFTPMAVGKMPFAPVDVRGTRNVDGDLFITAQRRTRMTTRLIGALGVSIPLGEAEERYELDIITDSSEVALRTLTGTAWPIEYSVEAQIEDGITPFDPVSVRAYQISATVGRGYALEGVV